MEVNDFLKLIYENNNIVFKLNDTFYSLFNKRLSKHITIASIDVEPQHFPSINKMLHGAILQKRSLLDCIEDIEIVNGIDLSYEFMKHWFIVHYAEIEFYYNGVSCWITRGENDLAYLSSDEFSYVFNSPKELFDNALIFGKKLIDIWPEIELMNY